MKLECDKMIRQTVTTVFFGGLLAFSAVTSAAELSESDPLLLAQTESKENRDNRQDGRQDGRDSRQDGRDMNQDERDDDRDNRQDCRQDEGVVGDDKRDCKQQG